MKHVSISPNSGASARLRIKRWTALSTIVFVAFAAANAGLLFFASGDAATIRADHSVTPSQFVVVPGNGRLHVSWRPVPNHTYELEFRSAESVSTPWNLVRDPGVYRYEITGLANNHEYEVRMRSMAAHESTASRNVFSAWTQIESAEPRALAGSSNDTPTWRTTVDSVTLEENQTYLSAIATFQAIGGDTNDVVNYEILSPVRGPFAMNAKTGEVYVYERLDFETTEEYEITVAATDLGGASIRHQMTIEVTDREGPPIPELTQVCGGNGTAFLVWDQINTATYDIQWRQLENPNYSAVDSRNIKMVDSDRRIVEGLANGVEWVFHLRAVDKETGEQSKWSADYVVVPSIDESRANNPPTFRQSRYSFDVPEEQAAGFQVGAVSATDVDPYSQRRFAIAETEPANAPFVINESSGEITTTDQLDYESVAVYTLNVVVTDLCGLSTRTPVRVTVTNLVEVDVPADTPLAPTVAIGHTQAMVLWDNFSDFKHDLDWRRADERYGLTPKDQNASSPRVVELDDPDVQYAFRIRARNLVGQVGPWSSETIVTPSSELPTILPIVSPREGAVLGDAIPYLSSINLRKGQDTLIGVNMFNTDGALDNSLADREDIEIRWTASIGDIDDPDARSTVYIAPHRVGTDFAVRVSITQSLPGGGAVVVRKRIPVRVFGEGQTVEIVAGDEDPPDEIMFRGDGYRIATFNEGGKYNVAATAGASFEVSPLSIPVRDWIGVRLFEGVEANILQPNVRRFDTIGNWYEVDYVSSDALPIAGLAFTPHAELCLPVPNNVQPSLLDDIEIMLLLDDGVQQLLNSPKRRAADLATGAPAKVCARASTFDGLLFLVLPEALQPTATPETPTVTLTPTPVPVVPTAIPEPIATPVPPASPTAVVFPPTETPLPTDTPEPTATHTPAPTDTPTPVPTDTPTPTPTATDTPTPVPTDTPVPTATPTSTPTPTNTPTATATPEPTRTPLPTSTSTPVPTATPTTTSTPTPVIEPPVEDEPSAAGWIIAIVVMALLAGAIGAGAMIYRARISQSSQQDSPEPVDDDDGYVEIDPHADEDDDDPPSQSSDDDDYDVLRYDMPSGR
ncbi:MAG: cadherin domain-containing protein [Chloroflexi bacterium]|nr:cadherin domain-containing protein [Chloroflexota bacterium]